MNQRIQKLYNVLVIGGALAAAACGHSTAPPRTAADAATGLPAADAATGLPAADAATGLPSGTAPAMPAEPAPVKAPPAQTAATPAPAAEPSIDPEAGGVRGWQ